MPLIEINRGVIMSVSNSQKMLQSSCWRKLAGIVGFFQVSFFLFITLLCISAAFIQIFTGVAPYQHELFHAIHSGILVTTIHRDIMESHNFAIFGSNNTLVEETIQTGIVQQGISISHGLKIELEDADWGTILSIYIFTALITANQCFRGAQLLRASLKWQHPKRAMALMKCWRSSVTAFRNNLFGLLLGTLLFASNISGIVVLVLGGLWMALCLISLTANGYYKELSNAISSNNDEENDF